jgi:hypothetical protein
VSGQKALGWISGLMDRHDLDTVPLQVIEIQRNIEGSNPSLYAKTFVNTAH